MKTLRPTPLALAITALAMAANAQAQTPAPAPRADSGELQTVVKADFKLNWRINDSFALQAFVDNLTDKQTLNRFVWGGGGALQVSAAPPRTMGLRLSYSAF